MHSICRLPKALAAIILATAISAVLLAGLGFYGALSMAEAKTKKCKANGCTTSPPPPPPPPPSPSPSPPSSGCTKYLTSGSLESFANSLAPGDVGCVGAGTYTESDSTVTINAGGTSSSSRITLMADPAATSKPRVNARLAVAATADYLTIKGMEWDGSYTPACGSGASCTILPGVTWNGDYGEIISNDIHSRRPGSEATLAGICIDAGTSGNLISGLLIRDNRIHNCGRLPSGNHDHGIYLEHTRDTQVLNNYLYDNSDRAVQLYPDADGSLIKGNIMDGNGEGVIFSGDTSTASDNNLLEGNVISNSTIRWLIEDYWVSLVGVGNTANNNCLWPTNSNSTYDQNIGIEVGASGFTYLGNVQADPQFFDRASKDLRIKTGTACANTFAGPTSMTY